MGVALGLFVLLFKKIEHAQNKEVICQKRDIIGIGYFWVSRDISSNHGIVRMGIIGKLLVFVGFLIAWYMGEVALIIVGAGVVDLIFAILFIEFLNSYGKMEAHG